jgi:hypothetical protein
MQTQEFIGTKFADWFGAFYAPAVAEPTAQEKIERIEAEIAAMPQAELVTVHHFAPGMYARELRIPAGVVLTGKIHLTEHINTISAGRIMVYTEDGGAREICAPCTIVSKPGTKRVGIALEDTVWTCYHATNETDLDRLEAELVTDSFAAYRARMIEV